MKQLIRFARTNETVYPFVRWFRDHALYAKGLHRGTFSQHGEDVWLRKHCPDVGFYIDIGASHPFLLSNTYLLYLEGWRGVTVEPIPGLAALHRKWRPEDFLIQKAVGPVAGKLFFHELFPSVLSTLDADVAERAVLNGTAEAVRQYAIDVITLDDLLYQHAPCDYVVDLLSIDLEGLDADVVCSCAFIRVRPRVIIVEFNDVPARTRTLDHLTHCGYHLVAELGCNLIMEDR